MKSISEKTINYIVWRLSEMPDIINSLPQNSQKYPDKRINCRIMMIEDILKSYRQTDADTLIDLINKKDQKGVKLFLFGV